MTDITFQDPPKDSRGGFRGGSKWPAIGDALRARPGEWALVHHGSSSTMVMIKSGRVLIGPGPFEVTSRKTDDGKSDVYARYVGES